MEVSIFILPNFANQQKFKQNEQQNRRTRSRHKNRMGNQTRKNQINQLGLSSSNQTDSKVVACKLSSFQKWLDEINQLTNGIDRVYFEEVRRHIGLMQLMPTAAALAYLTSWCEENKIPLPRHTSQTIKKHITKKVTPANRNHDRGKKLGFNPADDNEADALTLTFGDQKKNWRRFVAENKIRSNAISDACTKNKSMLRKIKREAFNNDRFLVVKVDDERLGHLIKQIGEKKFIKIKRRKICKIKKNLDWKLVCRCLWKQSNHQNYPQQSCTDYSKAGQSHLKWNWNYSHGSKTKEMASNTNNLRMEKGCQWILFCWKLKEDHLASFSRK